jgi:hypothetical protein
VNYQQPIKPTTGFCEMQTSGAGSDHGPLANTGSSQERPGPFLQPWAALQRVHARELARIELVFGRLPARGAR